MSFPKRIARKLHNWIGESGITCDFRLPRRWIRADKEEGANGIAEGQYERERLSAGSARGALDEGEGGEVEPDDDWWSDRLGQEGLILPLLIITFSCAYVVPHLALGAPATLVATLGERASPRDVFRRLAVSRIIANDQISRCWHAHSLFHICDQHDGVSWADPIPCSYLPL